MGQFHNRGATASRPVLPSPSGNRIKRRPGSGNQAHNMPAPTAEQGSLPNVDQSAVPDPSQASRPFSAGQPADRCREKQKKRRRRRRRHFLKCAEEQYEEKTPTGWLSSDDRKWLSFFDRSHAHRIAVEWDQDGEQREGVFIPRRDTSSWLNTKVGGKLFPGEHHRATFAVTERDDHYRIVLDSDDHKTHLLVDGHASTELSKGTVFGSLTEASDFFQRGALGYSVTARPGEFDGLELRSTTWHVTPVAIEKVESSFFENRSLFPPGSVRFDCALLMRGIDHEWHGRESLCSN